MCYGSISVRTALKFVNTLCATERRCVKSLFEYVRGDVRSLVGCNLRQIFLETQVLVIPGVTRPSKLINYCMRSSLKLTFKIMQIEQSILQVIYKIINYYFY